MPSSVIPEESESSASSLSLTFQGEWPQVFEPGHLDHKYWVKWPIWTCTPNNHFWMNWPLGLLWGGPKALHIKNSNPVKPFWKAKVSVSIADSSNKIFLYFLPAVIFVAKDLQMDSDSEVWELPPSKNTWYLAVSLQYFSTKVLEHVFCKWVSTTCLYLFWVCNLYSIKSKRQNDSQGN